MAKNIFKALAKGVVYTLAGLGDPVAITVATVDIGAGMVKSMIEADKFEKEMEERKRRFEESMKRFERMESEYYEVMEEMAAD